MRAVVFRQHSASLDVYEVIDDLPVPEIGADEVLVKVEYTALNRLDDFVRRGWPGLQLQFPHIPCSDFSGTIADVGKAVRGWQTGQRVTANPLVWRGEDRAILAGQQNQSRLSYIIGEHVPGACAEYVKIPARNLVAVPDGFDMRKAGAASLVYLTAWHNLLVAGNLRAGERILVVGAGGGVNVASQQIARLAGAAVYVVASDAGKARQAQQLGADWVHDRSSDPDWSKAVFYATGREGVDMVVDNVGKATWASSLRTLRPGGRLVSVGGTTGYDATVPVNLIFYKHLSIIGSTMGTQEDYLNVMQQIFLGKLDPIVDSVFPLSEYVNAVSHMLESNHFGKIVIDVNP